MGICSFLLAQIFISFSSSCSTLITLGRITPTSFWLCSSSGTDPVLSPGSGHNCYSQGDGIYWLHRHGHETQTRPMRHNTRSLVGTSGNNLFFLLGGDVSLQLRGATLWQGGGSMVTWECCPHRGKWPEENDMALASGPSHSYSSTTWDFSSVCANQVLCYFWEFELDFCTCTENGMNDTESPIHS